MTYVIGSPCIDQLDRSCIDVCPVDCIYVGDRKSYINPNECIDCGACEVECPVSAIKHQRKASTDPLWQPHVEDAHEFFSTILGDRSTPLGDPAGAGTVGDLGHDTPLVRDWPDT